MDNQQCQLWFSQDFVPTVLQSNLKQEVDDKTILHWSLHGSRFLNLAYPESDIDIVIIVNNKIDIKDQCQILAKLGSEVELTPRTKRPIVCLDKQGLPKIEVCIYTHDLYVQWYLHNTRSIAKWTPEERKVYITKMRQCFLDKDDAGKQKLKRWAYFELEDVQDLSLQNRQEFDARYLFSR